MEAINTGAMGSRNSSFIESLPVMLQGALPFSPANSASTCGPSTPRSISLIGLEVGPYVTIVIAGTSLYAYPFQTPAQVVPRGPWKKVQHRTVSSATHFKRACPWTQLMEVLLLLCRHSPPTIPLANIQFQQPKPWLEPKDPDIIHKMDTDDVGSVSWILRGTTDLEA